MSGAAGALSPNIRLGVIRLLDREADDTERADRIAAKSGYHVAESYGEGHADYWPRLTNLVGEMHDPRAKEVLLKPSVVRDGTLNPSHLGIFGEAVLPRLIKVFGKPGNKTAEFQLPSIYAHMLRHNLVTNTKDKAAIRQIFMHETVSPDRFSRGSGAKGLAEFDDPETLARLRELAQSDPDYPVRDDAERALTQRGGN
jgi:hypothetical protein